MHNDLYGLFEDEIIADFFAGGGGASTGVEMALGQPVTIAVNHCKTAIAMHRANHPKTLHYNTDIWELDPIQALKDSGGKRIGLAWWSPSCTHFSIARGGVPVDKNIRGQAWLALKWSLNVSIRVHALENVKEFQDWSPVIKNENGDMEPDRDRKGEIYRDFIKAFTTGLKPTDPSWKEAIRSCDIEFDIQKKLRLFKGLGYQFGSREMKAHEFGAATTRNRLFVILRNDGLPIRWPKPTHGDRTVHPERLAQRVANDIVDFNIPTTSIFLRPRPLAPKTMLRLARGFDRFVIHNDTPDVIASEQAPEMVQSKVNKMPDMEVYQVQEFLNQFFSGCDDTVIKTDTRQTPLKMSNVVHEEGQPICFTFYTKMRGTNVGFTSRSPIHTLSANGNHIGLVAVWLKRIGTLKNRESFNEIEIVKLNGQMVLSRSGKLYKLLDIGLRMLKPHEMYDAHGFPSSYQFKTGHDGIPLTQAQQVHKVGNSVCPPIVKALVAANFLSSDSRVA